MIKAVAKRGGGVSHSACKACFLSALHAIKKHGFYITTGNQSATKRVFGSMWATEGCCCERRRPMFWRVINRPDVDCVILYSTDFRPGIVRVVMSTSNLSCQVCQCLCSWFGRREAPYTLLTLRQHCKKRICFFKSWIFSKLLLFIHILEIQETPINTILNCVLRCLMQNNKFLFQKCCTHTFSMKCFFSVTCKFNIKITFSDKSSKSRLVSVSH